MAKLKGIKRIDRIINDFTAQFGITANLDTEFQAFCNDMTIGYTLVFDAVNKELFIEDVKARYPEVTADIFLWCLMHEIGHCMTEQMWSEEEREYFNYQKDRLAFQEEDQDRADWYHACPDEFFATKWAGDYMRKHPKKIAKFWNELQAATMRMYRKNGLID